MTTALGGSPGFSINLGTGQESFQEYILSCTECHQTCLETINYCIDQEGKHTESSHLQKLYDCAQICQLTADFLIRKSDHSHQICKICAEICQICADDCEQFSDERMKDCEESCRRCAELCQQIETHH